MPDTQSAHPQGTCFPGFGHHQDDYGDARNMLPAQRSAPIEPRDGYAASSGELRPGPRGLAMGVKHGVFVAEASIKALMYLVEMKKQDAPDRHVVILSNEARDMRHWIELFNEWLDVEHAREDRFGESLRLGIEFNSTGSPLLELPPDLFLYHFKDMSKEIEGGRTEVAGKDWGASIRLMLDLAHALRSARLAGSDQAQADPFSIWDDACFFACDLLRELLSHNDDLAMRVFKEHGTKALTFLQCLLGADSPFRIPGEHVAITDAAMLPSREERAESVRTVATETLIGYMLRESDAHGEGASGISRQVKDLTEECVAEETRAAPMLKLGHYFSEFFLRDRAWALGLLGRLFPKEPRRRPLYIGAWTGYLSDNALEDMFFEPPIQELYGRGLLLRTEPGERVSPGHYFAPEQGIANHFAIACVDFAGFGFDHPLFSRFREAATQEQMRDFVATVGRMIRGDSDTVSSFAKERLLKFWRWLLAEWDGRLPFLELGGWVNTRTGTFPPAELAELAHRSLQMTSGEFSWYHGLNKSVPELASASPKHTAGIVRLFLHGDAAVDHARDVALSIGSGWHEAVRRLIAHRETSPEARELLKEIESHGEIR